MDPDMVIFAKGIASGYPFAGEPALHPSIHGLLQ
jgi:4-aminobutyrate aminotransferase-like enzyme